jgi:cytochrome c553
MKANCIQWWRWFVPTSALWAILVVNSIQMVQGGDANELFVKNCAACHGKDGKAQTSVAKKLGVKDLSQSIITDAKIEQQIREGRPADQNSAKMPAFQDRLTAVEIKSLTPVVKEFRHSQSWNPEQAGDCSTLGLHHQSPNGTARLSPGEFAFVERPKRRPRVLTASIWNCVGVQGEESSTKAHCSASVSPLLSSLFRSEQHWKAARPSEVFNRTKSPRMG